MGLLSMTTCWSWLCFLTMVSQRWSLMVVLDNTAVLEKALNQPHFSTAGSEKPSFLVQSSHSCVQCGDILKIQSMTKTLNFLLYLQLVLIICGLISILSLTCVTTWILTSFGGSMYYAENFYVLFYTELFYRCHILPDTVSLWYIYIGQTSIEWLEKNQIYQYKKICNIGQYNNYLLPNMCWTQMCFISRFKN